MKFWTFLKVVLGIWLLFLKRINLFCCFRVFFIPDWIRNLSVVQIWMHPTVFKYHFMSLPAPQEFSLKKKLRWPRFCKAGKAQTTFYFLSLSRRTTSVQAPVTTQHQFIIASLHHYMIISFYWEEHQACKHHSQHKSLQQLFFYSWSCTILDWIGSKGKVHKKRRRQNIEKLVLGGWVSVENDIF